MKLLWCCVAAALLTNAFAAIDVEKTVQQVQTILKSNSQLPRLNRDEILQLLNDIRAEDASKSTSASKEISKENEVISTTPFKADNNDINPTAKLPDLNRNVAKSDPNISSSVSTVFEATTKNTEPSVMVVLPYTPRDGSSLQELYTKPPRVEVVPVSKVNPNRINSNERLTETLKTNAKIANQQKLDLPNELREFLDAHGLKSKPGQDHFLLPLEGFKPLPPAKIIDGNVQLPENILLTYDLISSDHKINGEKNSGQLLSDNFLFEPLRPELPFELDTSSSETKESVLPLDLPKKRNTNKQKQNYEPIDYDSVKVIPLNNGPNPLLDDDITLQSEQNKRQTNTSDSVKNETSIVAKVEETSVSAESNDSTTEAPKVADSAAADSGASIADLEDSFGGAAPEVPGDSELPPPKKNGFYWMVDWNSFLEVGDGDTKVNIRFEPKLGDPQMFIPVNVP